MLRCCIICKAGASPNLQLQYCSVCKSALYCSEACQKTDWRTQHKTICKLLNVGHGDMQVRSNEHTILSIHFKERFEIRERSLDEEDKRFFKLFEESTLEGSRTAALEMREIAERQTKRNQKFLLFHSLYPLIRSDSKMLSWPNSPLLVMLQFVDPNVLTGDQDAPLREDEERATPLHMLADLVDPFDYSTHKNQLILAKQLIEHGAKVKAVMSLRGETPLHNACSGCNVINLDFVELLLKGGADPNVQDRLGMTPLMVTTPYAPGAAKFLLNWPTTDVNATARCGASFLTLLHCTVEHFSEQILRPDNPEHIQHQFLLQQWREIEVMLVERGVHNAGITVPS
jgi:hypothetical protein